MILEQKGTRMGEDGEDWNGLIIGNDDFEKFSQLFQNAETVT